MSWYLHSADTAAVPPLRHEIMSYLRHQADAGSDFASAELVIGELLSNAVAHTSEQARVSLCWEGDHPVLSVTDLGRTQHRRVRRRRSRVHAGAGAPVATVPPEAMLAEAVLPESILDHVADEPVLAEGMPDADIPATAPGTPGLPRPVLPDDLLADSGRGLFIADLLARELAVRGHGGAPMVSATLDLTRRPTDPTPPAGSPDDVPG
jgi:anti-sigma regulatory factor (Ser/Thr protein kinase)